jgi:SMODS and SLOG-associating 2TM effector domain 2
MIKKIEHLQSFITFPNAEWAPDTDAASVSAIMSFSESIGTNAEAWYFGRVKVKKFGGRILRVGAIMLTTLGGLLPMISEMARAAKERHEMMVFTFSPVWASVFIALAGALLLLDRFWGFTSAWVRYLTTGQKISEALATFRFDIQDCRRGWSGGRPSSEQIGYALQRCREFVGLINAIVREETNAWASEFQGTLSKIDEAMKNAPSVTAHGALDLKVANGDAVSEWVVQIGGGAPQKRSGKEIAFGGLSPGLITVRITAVDNAGKPLAIERSVLIKSGEATNLSVTLG